MSLFALAGWFFSVPRKNVTHVDSMWSLFFLIAALSTAYLSEALSLRAIIVLVLVAAWSIRLCIYLTWRNWGPHEDHRYAQIRQNNSPYFWLKSIYIVFGLQTLLAWAVAISLIVAIAADNALNIVDYIGFILVVFGLCWETIADWQLSIFKSDPTSKGKVFSSGLWRYSRHPNYFGECMVWWGFYLFALATGAWWAVLSPILMTLLLLKVSGVSLLESTIKERRPAYAEYINTTNAFFPGSSNKSTKN